MESTGNVGRKARSWAVSGAAIAGLVVGMIAPAAAYYRADNGMSFTDQENDSARWTDSTPDFADARVTVKSGCNRAFTVRIREDKGALQPDPIRGSEWVNCTEYTDAVYANSSTVKTRKHHYDGTDIGVKSAKPYVPKYAKFDAVVRW